ncbi:TetR/AcrR family transcriptional regulator [Amycolatopsis acidiphila]|uniref:TetR/AcrR family transcriptional regulator n=1 Tax=Amycolatopsis acidiphila TaxID=715473 RepID=A0A558A6N6_9PSEU|nr:TetR/AcrR family transcriptional regulator [Amycolatopsis acidiphila]TVT19925.1 TetR/AcrR family transcriptional regulator [Amycolatopsis acidiphila]UIJ60082.1 TetR/AcrR family transcriptional regulator [Amycolatopsis acidiphila]GHG61462.1 TetR family transcriptional regulator [Amycolatopsis acidiphila]
MPRSSSANEEMRTQARQKILAAALQVFAEKGYHGATITEITQRAGVSRGLASYYFPNKHLLVEELLDAYLDGVAAIIDVPGGPDERLGGIIDGVLGGMMSNLPVQGVILSLVVQPSTHPIFAEVEARKDERLSLLEDSLRELFEQRGAEDPAVEEIMLRSVLEGVIYKAVVYGPQYPVEQVRRRLYRMYELAEPKTTLSGAEPGLAGRLRATDRGF